MKAWLTDLAKRGFRKAGYELRNTRYAYLDPFADMARWLQADSAPVIFDVGANRGDTIAIFRTRLPGCSVHAFEPTPALAESLKTRFASDSRVHITQAAVSDRLGSTTFYLKGNDLLNSTLPPQTSGADYHGVSSAGTLTVPTLTLASYCESQAVREIHALKIDIEGAEKLALQGALPLLERHAIGMIYLEVHFSNIYHGQTTLADIDGLLRNRGYEVYGLYEITRFGTGAIDFFNMLYLSPERYHALPPHGLY